MTPAAPAVLQVEGLSHRYGTTTVLRDVSFAVAPGEVVAVVGPSGAGKTTLFRCITRLVEPEQGSVRVGGRDLAALRGRDRRLARRDVGLIFQQYNLVRRRTALGNVLLGRLARFPAWRALLQRPGSDEETLARACLEQVGLADYAGARADRLSGGQQQRVAIARALAQRSRVILADEPVASLDPASAGGVLDALAAVARDHGIAVVCSLHQVDMIAGFADRVVGLRAGEVVLDVPVTDFADDRRAAVYGAASGGAGVAPPMTGDIVGARRHGSPGRTPG
jgi:phosphonate transport system ATP-binding protein